MVHINTDASQELPDPHTWLENGPVLSPAVVKRLASEASLVTVLEDGKGNVLNVGRKTRTVPPSIRRALLLRDQGCRFPGCCEAKYVDAHHIHHWCDGGETCLDNLVLLCRRHHRLLHELKGKDKGRWSVWVSGNWRVTFKFEEVDASNVDYEDYH